MGRQHAPLRGGQTISGKCTCRVLAAGFTHIQLLLFWLAHDMFRPLTQNRIGRWALSFLGDGVGFVRGPLLHTVHVVTSVNAFVE